MRVIAVVNSKGGVGKTTLASALAVRAARDSKRVAMVDLDPQGSLAAWWKRRGSTDNPCIFTGADTATDAVEKLALNGWDWVFIDTPPAFRPTLEDAITNAHLAVIPFKPSAFDLTSEDAVLLARDAGIAHMCVINDADPRWGTTPAAREHLLAAGVPVAETIICHRQAYVGAVSYGRSGPEIEKPRKAGQPTATETEISALWGEIIKRLKKPARRAREAVHG